jgi:serine/threonine protein kinase
MSEAQPVASRPDLPPGGPDGPFPGEFRLVRRLGRGAFGEVWLAEDLSPLDRLVALKFLRGDGPGAAQALAVLHNDARLLASVRHPNVVQVHAWLRPAAADVGPCMVLQYVSGGSLESRVLRDGPLPWQLAARYLADVADGLCQVHRKGIVHRDVKPANVLWDKEADEALLTDFGVAARLGGPASLGGTPLFMAPEAFAGVIAPSLDVYSLAATLCWLVVGQPPFPAGDRSTLVRAIERGLPTPEPRFAVLPEGLERLLRAGLAADPSRRPTLPDFARALRGSLNQLLADSLVQAPAAAAPAGLRLVVSRQVDANTCVPIASTPTHSEGPALRDMKRVPRAPERVTLHTGERVRIEVRADRPGFVTVFNVGPTGNLNLLYPDGPHAEPARVEAGRAQHVLDVELTPPAGQERLFALWSREPLPLRLEELLSLVRQGEVPGAGAYQATRDMARVNQSLQSLRPEDRCAVVLELDHR